MNPLKTIARTLLGSVYAPLQRRWSAVRHEQRWRGAQRRAARVREYLVSRTQRQVAGGPFAGMRYVEAAAEGSLFPKLVGSYEIELASVIERIASRPYDLIVNVGSADGYYAVGLARRLPQAAVVAIDIDPRAREATAEMAALNGVAARVRTAEALDGSLLTDAATLIVCDCEGCERELLDPLRFPRLRGADILVELHEFLDATIADTLTERFRESHEITIIDAVPRDAAAYPLLRGLPAADRNLALDEMRPPGMRWAWMTALAVF